MTTGSPEGLWSRSNDQSEEPLQTHTNQKAGITHVIIIFYAVLALKVRPDGIKSLLGSTLSHRTKLSCLMEAVILSVILNNNEKLCMCAVMITHSAP